MTKHRRPGERHNWEVMRLSVQLYTVRDEISHDLSGTLAELSSIGLEYVELAGLSGHSVEDWKAALAANNLQVSGAHVGVERFENEFDAVVTEAKELGYDLVIVPWIGAEAGKDGWDAVGKSLEPYAAKAKEAGLRFAYHNHAHEFEGDGLDKFYAATDPSLVLAELDLAWVQIGGQVPAEYVAKYAGRVATVHLKDYDPTLDPQWRPAGQGIVDWDATLAACLAANVEFGAVELDQSPAAPLDAVRESYQFFAGKGLK